MSKHHTFTVQCCHCNRVISKKARTDISKDVVSHGMCWPMCEQAKAAGWGQFEGAIAEKRAKEVAA